MYYHLQSIAQFSFATETSLSVLTYGPVRPEVNLMTLGFVIGEMVRVGMNFLSFLYRHV